MRSHTGNAAVGRLGRAGRRSDGHRAIRSGDDRRSGFGFGSAVVCIAARRVLKARYVLDALGSDLIDKVLQNLLALLNVGQVHFYGDLLDSALEAEERVNVERRLLTIAREILILLVRRIQAMLANSQSRVETLVPRLDVERSRAPIERVALNKPSMIDSGNLSQNISVEGEKTLDCSVESEFPMSHRR